MSTVSSWLASGLFVASCCEDEVRMLECDDSGSFESSSPKLDLLLSRDDNPTDNCVHVNTIVTGTSINFIGDCSGFK